MISLLVKSSRLHGFHTGIVPLRSMYVCTSYPYGNFWLKQPCLIQGWKYEQPCLIQGWKYHGFAMFLPCCNLDRWLLTPCNHLKIIDILLIYLCKGYMASTLQRFVIPLLGHCNLSIPLLKHFIKDPPHSRSTL